MDSKEWLKYSVVLKQGFVNSKDYLQNEFHLLEKASLALEETFSVEQILLFCMDKTHLTGFKFNERKDFGKTLFEIYFGYSRNLLLYFDIYSSKSITDNTSQLVNCLSKFPQFPTHLTLMGYDYQRDTREWRHAESRLTNERREILLFMTICCCLGYSYLDQPLKFLKLTIFERRRLSLQNVIEERICEYCNFEFNKIELCCSVCSQGIDNMEFFKHWEINYNATLKEIQQTVYNTTGFEDKHDNEWTTNRLNTKTQSLQQLQSDYSGSDKEVGRPDTARFHSLPETWRCSSCTYNNQLESVTCDVCLSTKTDLSDHHNEDINDPTPLNENDQHSVTENWQCLACTMYNDIDNHTCSACLNPKTDRIRSNIYNSTLSGVTEESMKSYNSSAYVARGMGNHSCSRLDSVELSKRSSVSLDRNSFSMISRTDSVMKEDTNLLVSRGSSQYSKNDDKDSNIFIRFFIWLRNIFKCCSF